MTGLRPRHDRSMAPLMRGLSFMASSRLATCSLERTFRANVCWKMIILTVEDEFLISEYLRAILEAGGHTVITTFDADEAIRVLESERGIELVITDVNLPGSVL